ncbi:MAG: hypothetical protein AAGA55_02010 [Planctomycetota bacterium]
MTQFASRPVPRSRPGAAMLGALAGLALCSGVASGQTALGDGTALDNNPGAFGRGNYQRPSFAQELSFRNAVVTGNAPGGLSFRGDLGYRAAGEFTGALGSDALFTFRRDSLYSGLAGMGIRGTEAIQYQFSLTTGARPPGNLVGDLTVARDRLQTPSANQIGVNPLEDDRPGTLSFDPESPDPRGLRLYRPSAQQPELVETIADSLTGTLRSSSTYTSTTNLSPVVLSVYYEGIERDKFGLTSSPLTGVFASPMKDDDDGAEERNPSLPRDPAGERVRTAYDEVLTRLRERAAERAAASGEAPADAERSIAEQIQRMRLEMMGIEVPGATDAPSDPAGTPGLSPEPDAEQPGMVDPAATGPAVVDPAASITGEDARTRPFDPDSPVSDSFGGVSTGDQQTAFTLDESTLELLRDRDRPISVLVDPDAESRDLYSEHMRTGERLIMAERYFDAEERFARALGMRPGDQAAQIGRAHAQLGAGLVISASVNLRQLLTEHPEIISTRYAGRLLPGADRVDRLIDVLRERAGVVVVEGEGFEDVSVRRSSAFLLAYLGYQNERPEVVRQGLELLTEIGAADDRGFANVLHQVWLVGGEPQESP